MVEKLELLRRDLDIKLVRKGKEVERFSLYVHYHPWRFSAPGTHCKEYEIKVEASVLRYKDARNGHTAFQPYSMLVMGVSYDPVLVATPRDRIDLHRVILYSLTQAYGIGENHITFPSAAHPEYPEGGGGVLCPSPTSLRYYANGRKCPRHFCRGVMFPDTDNRLRCLLCGRYEDTV